VICDAVGQHSVAAPEALADRGRIAAFEALDDHEQARKRS
jgi:hypothetical protein